MSECELCDSTENVDEHHVSYEPEETVDLCRSCHFEVHGDEDHPLYPDDEPKVTTITVSRYTKARLNEIRDGRPWDVFLEELPKENADPLPLNGANEIADRINEQLDVTPKNVTLDAEERSRIARDVAEELR